MVQGSWIVLSDNTRPGSNNNYVVVIGPLGPSPLGLLTLKVTLETLPVDCSIILYYIQTERFDLPSTVATPS